MKILHVFYDLTHLTGYQVRSRYVLSKQKDLGLDISAVFLPTRVKNAFEVELGDVLVRPVMIPASFGKSLSVGSSFPVIGTIQRALLRRFLRGQLAEIIRQEQPHVVHAHSAWMSAAQAFAAARSARAPILYELRGLWEETGVAEKKTTKLGARYWYFRLNENHLIRRSDAIVTVSDGLRQEAISRGADSGCVHVIPNGVDTEAFAPVQPDVALARSLGCDGRIVVGYISSLRRMEGVRYLVEAMSKVDEQASAIIVGDGPEKAVLEDLTCRMHLEDRVRFVGAVPHDDIRKYYSIIDVFVVPRIKAKVCEMVTPLKPLEAMAMGKCVLMSDVQGLRELAEAEGTALFFEPENSEDLSANLNRLIRDVALRRRIGERARSYVVERRDWRNIVTGYIPIYERLVR